MNNIQLLWQHLDPDVAMGTSKGIGWMCEAYITLPTHISESKATLFLYLILETLTLSTMQKLRLCGKDDGALQFLESDD